MENIIKQTVAVNGITCAGCVATVEKTLNAARGVSQATVNFANKKATIEYDQSTVSLEKLRNQLQSAGYDLEIEFKESGNKQSSYLKARKNTIWAAIFTLPIVLLSMVFMNIPFNSYYQFALTSVVLFVFGRQFFIIAWKQARHRNMNMDTLVALSTGIAYLFSTIVTFFPAVIESIGIPGHIYFESAAVIVVFILAGRWMEEKAKAGTSEALEKLMGLQPSTVWYIDDDENTLEKEVAEIVPGDRLMIKPGERIPLDGKIIKGNGFVDESMLTGEPIPVEKERGEEVFSGTINQNNSFRIEVLKTAEDTVLSQIIKRVEEAQGSKAPVQKLVDRIASIFVPVVVGIAILAMVLWFVFGGENAFSHGLLALITVLIIACPCALGLATPTAIMVGVGKGAEHGILIRDAESLENANKVDTVILDKTGTITEGRPKVIREWWSDESKKGLLYLIENASEHPLANAVTEHLADFNEKVNQDIQFQSITGKGVKAMVGNHSYFVGNKQLVADQNLDLPSNIQTEFNRWSTEGHTVIFFFDSTELIALLALSDKIKEHSKKAINQLEKLGLEVIMLTGDQPMAAKRIAEKTNITKYEGGLLPQQKSEYIKQLQQTGKKVAMVGDGINDSEALALADVSVAMGHGSDIAMDVAKMTIVSSDLIYLPKAIDLSKRTVLTIKQNLFWAFIYNIVGIPIAAGILYPVTGFLLNPMIAGAAMAMSSVSVVLNSLRLKNYKFS
ncbi:heavy metal translocating P-type ATPase [Membranihabitans maritimus]|uniref:heavy metal translocating P-type ATPase n=1 Tax=Membranihabitans maritimus TaxID=2904244 RepID=UPI001F3348D9|nr:heavy metal translocating P-type ATPase [Membranihabitans maritimus]